MTQHHEPERLAQQIGQQLAKEPLSLRQQTRLAAARQQALGRAAAHAPVGILAGLEGWRIRHPLGARLAGQSAILALLLVAGLAWWQLQPDSFIDDDVDTQLLADEVPVDAWLSDTVIAPGEGQS